MTKYVQQGYRIEIRPYWVDEQIDEKTIGEAFRGGIDEYPPCRELDTIAENVEEVLRIVREFFKGE